MVPNSGLMGRREVGGLSPLPRPPAPSGLGSRAHIPLAALGCWSPPQAVLRRQERPRHWGRDGAGEAAVLTCRGLPLSCSGPPGPPLQRAGRRPVSAPARLLSRGHTRKSLPPGLPAGCSGQHGVVSQRRWDRTCLVLQGRICVKGQLAGPSALHVGSLDARQAVWWGTGCQDAASAPWGDRLRPRPMGSRAKAAPRVRLPREQATRGGPGVRSGCGRRFVPRVSFLLLGCTSPPRTGCGSAAVGSGRKLHSCFRASCGLLRSCYFLPAGEVVLSAKHWPWRAALSSDNAQPGVETTNLATFSALTLWVPFRNHREQWD